jgi:hypothetical protein
MYTLPVEADEATPRADVNEPVLLTAYPDHQSVAVVFNSMLRHFRCKGWDEFDTGNWRTMSVYPEQVDGFAWSGPLPMPVRVRKLSPAQCARASEELTDRAPEGLPILQVQLPDVMGRWPGQPGYAELAQVMEDAFDFILGDLT